MSDIDSQLFKDWMIATGKTRNTSFSYFSGVNAVSKHCNRDVFEITDLDELERLYQLYGPKGKYADIGASTNNTGNVQNGLKQWLEYQRVLQQAPDIVGDSTVIDGYADQRVLQLLRKGTTEEQAWAWTLLRCFRQRYPHADHWTVNISPPDIRIGVREKDSLKGKPVFTLYWYGGAICCSLRGIADYRALMEAQNLRWQIDSSDYPTLADISNWLDSVENVLKGKQLTLSGTRLIPRDYGQAEQEEPGVKEATTETAVKPALNQILFGPPGTGKTYATIEAALEVLAPGYLHEQWDNRAALKQRFDELVQQDRIRFVTFHQSFSYEDFVEGLRATTDEATQQLRYEVVNGVFKSLCEAAAAKVTQQAEAPTELGQRRIWKMSLGNTLGEDASIYQECLAGGYVLLGYGGAIDFAGCTNRQQVQARFAEAGVVPANPTTDYGITSVTAFVSRMNAGDLIVVSDGNFKFRAIGEVMGEYQFKAHTEFEADYSQMRPVKWLRQYQPSLPHSELLNGQFSQMTLYELRSPTLDKKKLQVLLGVGSEEISLASDERVLIIDEINRGNISRIFGELITLIEPSKRAAADEALSVMLPYSKQPFSVPSNLYLIGTMNTADRSLAGLDIALRRRFVFREMPPRPELLDDVEVSGLNIGQLLRVMNQRIEVLLDRDHCLGHAYFMPLKADASLTRLEAIFRNQILPLLQEYFFEDWQRIAWVLNDHSKAPSDQFIQQRKSLTEQLFGQEVGKGLVDSNWTLNDEAFERLESYLGIPDVLLLANQQSVKREATHGEFTLREFASGSIDVWRAGVLQQPTKPVLRELADRLGLTLESSSGSLLTTRGLGRQLLDRLSQG